MGTVELTFNDEYLVGHLNFVVIIATYGVGNDQNVGLGGGLSGGLGEVADDGGVGVEEVCKWRD